MFFSTLTSVLALASFASAAAPSVTYPHSGTVWENTWYHNVTWAPQSGNGNIMLMHGNTMTPLKNNVDLSSGRTVIQVPKSVMQAQDWVVQIMVGSDTSVSNTFAIGPPSAVAPGGSSASGSAIASSISASAGSSAAASAASSLQSSASQSASAASGVSSAAASVSSDINSLSASAASAVASSLSAASVSAQSSIESLVSSATSSGASKLSSIQSSATSPPSSSSTSSGAVPVAYSAFGAVVAAGLVAITTLSGALVL